MEQRLSDVGVHHNELITMGLLGLQRVAPLIQTLWGGGIRHHLTQVFESSC